MGSCCISSTSYASSAHRSGTRRTVAKINPQISRTRFSVVNSGYTRCKIPRSVSIPTFCRVFEVLAPETIVVAKQATRSTADSVTSQSLVSPHKFLVRAAGQMGRRLTRIAKRRRVSSRNPPSVAADCATRLMLIRRTITPGGPPRLRDDL
jgi:hypothetical protein